MLLRGDESPSAKPSSRCSAIAHYSHPLRTVVPAVVGVVDDDAAVVARFEIRNDAGYCSFALKFRTKPRLLVL